MSLQPLERSELAIRLKPTALDPMLLERLAETGFLASECGLPEQAEQIFTCLAKVRPGNPSPRVALAMVRARRGWVDQAIGELERVIVEYPASEMAKAALGLLLVQIPQPGALKLFEEVLAMGTDQSAVNVANCCIELARSQEAQSPSASSESLEYFRHYNIRSK